MTKDSLSDEDKELFRTYVQRVPPTKDQAESLQNIKTHYLSDYISETVLAETVLSYTICGIPPKQFKALKIGKTPVEARLDLHGLGIDNAREALSLFIQKAQQNHKRCVLIIHGKGGFHGEPPLIKNLVNRWLPQFAEVLAYHSAQPRHGGNGAVYVLLKTT